MCDEYDDERMRAFWRLVAERENLIVLPAETPEEPQVAMPAPVGLEGPSPKARAKPLTR